MYIAFSFDESEITFQIIPNAEINASQVVQRLEDKKKKIQKKLGYDIDFAEVRDKVNLYEVV